jgi:hypothetical protein
VKCTLQVTGGDLLLLAMMTNGEGWSASPVEYRDDGSILYQLGSLNGEVISRSVRMSDALLEYAYRRIVELEKLLLVDVAETVWPAEVSWSIHKLNAPGNYRRITRTVYAITSTACGWNKCPYRQSWTPPNRWPSSWRNTRERNHR